LAFGAFAGVELRSTARAFRGPSLQRLQRLAVGVDDAVVAEAVTALEAADGIAQGHAGQPGRLAVRAEGRLSYSVEQALDRGDVVRPVGSTIPDRLAQAKVIARQELTRTHGGSIGGGRMRIIVL